MGITDHELLRLIGGGSYGQVWLARNVVGTLRAVKVVTRETFGQAHPYEREYAGLQRFEPISRSHDGLVDILQIGRNDAEGYFYYVMELADDAGAGNGEECGTANSAQKSANSADGSFVGLTSYVPRTLGCRLRVQRRLPLADCIELGVAMTSALAHLHHHGLVHRDVKPSNIIFVGGVPKLADVGLVTHMTEARSFVGTEGFIPPEGPGTPSADLYSLGKVLYEASTGLDRNEFPKLPPDLKDSAERDRFSEFNEILLKACAPEAGYRYATAEEMRVDLGLLEHGKSVKRQRIIQQRWAFCRKAAAAMGALALVAAAAAFIWSGRHDRYQLSDDPKVNSLVADGNSAILDYTPERLIDALDFFNEALAREPKFAPAQIGVLRVRIAQQYDFAFDSPPAVSNVCAAVTNLVKMAPDLAESWIGRAYLEDLAGHDNEALAAASKARRMRPASREGVALVHLLSGLYHLGCGLPEPDETLREYQLAARELTADPAIEAALGLPLLAKGDLQQALECFKMADKLRPSCGANHWRGQIYEHLGDFQNAVREFERWDRWRGRYKGPEYYDGLRQASEKGGRAGYWGKLLELAQKEPLPREHPSRIPAILMHLGRTNEAYCSLEEAWKNHETDLANILLDNCWNSNDQGFKDFAKKVGLPRAFAATLGRQHHARR